MTTTTTPLAELATRWAELTAAEPRLRIRDAAVRLGTTEANLLETRLAAHRQGAGQEVRRLTGDLSELFTKLGTLGRCMALTRNEHAVHERKGTYEKISFGGHGGLVLGPDIDLRLFPKKWQVAYAVVDPAVEPARRSLQIFDKHGQAAHKVYLQGEEHVDAFEALVAEYLEEGASTPTAFQAPEPPKAETADAEIDVAGFQEAWLGMQDTHDFFMVCHRFGVSRTQALRLAPEGHATQVANDSLRSALDAARDAELPIMVFVGNGAVIQIHTGKVARTMEHGDWYNVLDPDFNLHVRETAIASSWIVRKPTKDGIVTSLELFDDKGENILLMFGERKPGKAELPEWLTLTEGLLK